MGCVTGKRQYDTQSQAEEALIETRGRFVFREGSGPIDVYQCDDCGYWHFTSKGTVSDLLKKADTKKQGTRKNQKRSKVYESSKNESIQSGR
jgi:hypothetical protein